MPMYPSRRSFSSRRSFTKKPTTKKLEKKFTDEQIKKLNDEIYDSYNNLSVEANELLIFTENDPDIYRQRETPIRENLEKKMKKGIYERSKAAKLAKYMFDDASKKYNKAYGSGIGHSFSPNQRREAAKHWVIIFEADYANNQPI